MSYLHIYSGIPTAYASGGHCPVLSSARVHTHSPPHPLRGLRTLVLWRTAWPQHQTAQWEREAVTLQFHHPGYTHMQTWIDFFFFFFNLVDCICCVLIKLLTYLEVLQVTIKTWWLFPPELSSNPSLASILIPAHARSQAAASTPTNPSSTTGQSHASSNNWIFHT